MKRILFVLALVAVVAPGAARAFVRSSVGGDGEIFLFWRDRTVSFVLHEAGSQDAGQAASLQASRESFAVWPQQACTDLKFEDQGTTARTDVGFDPKAIDNINLVIWRERLCGPTESVNEDNCWDSQRGDQTIAVTTTTYSNRTGEIFDADIEFNAAAPEFVFTTVSARPLCGPEVTGPPASLSCMGTDIKNTLVHEVGHVLGLDHVDAPDATMAPTASDGEVKKRSLAQDDIDGLCTVYPKGKPTPGVVDPVLVYGDGFGCAAAGLAGGTGGGFGLLVLAGVLRRRRPPRA